MTIKKKVSTKKKAVTPFTTIQILKTDKAKLMDLAMQISQESGKGYTNPPYPSVMVNKAVNHLDFAMRPRVGSIH